LERSKLRIIRPLARSVEKEAVPSDVGMGRENVDRRWKPVFKRTSEKVRTVGIRRKFRSNKRWRESRNRPNDAFSGTA
jgi:hypothetical protein